jgi:hypothetical protein
MVFTEIVVPQRQLWSVRRRIFEFGGKKNCTHFVKNYNNNDSPPRVLAVNNRNKRAIVIA